MRFPGIPDHPGFQGPERKKPAAVEGRADPAPFKAFAAEVWAQLGQD